MHEIGILASTLRKNFYYESHILDNLNELIIMKKSNSYSPDTISLLEDTNRLLTSYMSTITDYLHWYHDSNTEYSQDKFKEYINTHKKNIDKQINSDNGYIISSSFMYNMTKFQFQIDTRDILKLFNSMDITNRIDSMIKTPQFMHNDNPKQLVFDSLFPNSGKSYKEYNLIVIPKNNDIHDIKVDYSTIKYIYDFIKNASDNKLLEQTLKNINDDLCYLFSRIDENINKVEIVKNSMVEYENMLDMNIQQMYMIYYLECILNQVIECLFSVHYETYNTCIRTLKGLCMKIK